MFEALDILRWFFIAKRLDRLTSRTALEAHQQRQLDRLHQRILPRSPFYAPMATWPHDALPIMTKVGWMAHFDEINTVGLTLSQAMATAETAEKDRDFSPTLNGVAVGLSTGTSGQRGIFLVSPAERRRWAGLMLAKLLPSPLLVRRRVAFFLRANSRLYQDVDRSTLIEFRFFDLLEPLERSATNLMEFQPDVLIAPPSVLVILANLRQQGHISLNPERVVSVAEVLHSDDRRVIETAFCAPIAEVYQATEGALAMTCEAGSLHLNEAFVHIEPHWLDRSSRRFSPIVTDLTRSAQPVIRYLLDDILVAANQPCACGRASMTIEAVEGRADDVCAFQGIDGTIVRVFPDFLARAILGATVTLQDFRVVQVEPGALIISLASVDGEGSKAAVTAALTCLAHRVGAQPPRISFETWAHEASPKRRRIVNVTSAHGTYA